MYCFICCGGTGGHLSPGIAIAERLLESGHEVKLIVSNREVDSRLLKDYPHLISEKVSGQPFSYRPDKLLRCILSQIKGIFQAIQLIRNEMPDVLVGFGGYSTVGMSIAAFVCHIPIVLHEANRVPGRTIRWLSALATRVYLPSGVRLRSFLPRAIRYFGYPVRDRVMRYPMNEARKRMGFAETGRLLLVLGGSQGATALNNWVRNNLDRYIDEGIHVCCITGLNKGEDNVIEATSLEGDPTFVYYMTFCDDMGALISSADMAVARAGAGTLAEFMRCRLPSVLVPYPYAADQHQLKNAQFLERQGAAIVLEETVLEKLHDEVMDLIGNDFLLSSMRHNLSQLDRYNNADFLVSDIEQLYEQTLVEEKSARPVEGSDV